MIQSISAAANAMSEARSHIDNARFSKEGRIRAVAMASGIVVDPLLAPSRHVVDLLSGLSVLFPPCKQVSSTLAVRVSS